MHKSVFNLSKYILSEAENRLLDKGLLFIPTIKTFPVDEIIIAKDRLVRSLKINAFFEDKDRGKGETKKFEPPSTWTPSIGRLPQDAVKIINKINIETKRLLQHCPGTRKAELLLPGENNIDKDELAALKSLKNNRDVVIKSADKGGAIVLMDREAYVFEALRQLENPKYYRPLEEPVFPNNIDQINSIINKLYLTGKINKNQCKFLSADPDSVRARTFYLLPKIHKKPESWPQPGRMPEGRPIVSDCGSESYNVSGYIDSFIQPLSILHPAYTKDTYDFIDKIRGCKINVNHLLVTGDISSLYTNMNLDRILQVVKESFGKVPDSDRPDNEILDLLNLTLRNNDFEFDGKFYLQIHGTAMGKKYAPSLANLYLQYFDHMATTGFRIKPLNYHRFLDDIIFVWPGTVEDLVEYNAFLDNIIGDIKVTLNHSALEVNYLDTTVYKLTREDETSLQTRVYFKDTDTHQLLHTASFHPKHTTKGIVKSQLLRFKRISSCFEDFTKACGVLFEALQPRGYNPSLLRKMRREIWNSDPNPQPTSVDSSRPMIPLILRYNQLGHKFMKLWKGIVTDSDLFSEYRLVAAYSKNKNIRDHLVKSKLPEAIPINSLGKISTPAPRGRFSLCNSTKCHACKWHSMEGCTFKSEVYNTNFLIKQNVTCDSSNIVYLITCRKCKIQYVGETGRPFRDRLTDHRSSISTGKQTPIGIHFNLVGHSHLDLRATIIEQLPAGRDPPLIRKQREEFWQNKLGTKFPQGLNGMPTGL